MHLYEKSGLGFGEQLILHIPDLAYEPGPNLFYVDGQVGREPVFFQVLGVESIRPHVIVIGRRVNRLHSSQALLQLHVAEAAAEADLLVEGERGQIKVVVECAQEWVTVASRVFNSAQLQSGCYALPPVLSQDAGKSKRDASRRFVYQAEVCNPDIPVAVLCDEACIR